MPTDEECKDEDFATILRRNTYSRFSILLNDQTARNLDFDSPGNTQALSTDNSPAIPPGSCRLNPKAFNQLNSFNEEGHLSRKVFSDHGENHLNADEFENAFGYRKVFDNKFEVTAITATTIATCISSILLDLIVTGERMVDEGHYNSPDYNIFCGGGKNTRPRPLKQKYDEQENIPNCASGNSTMSPNTTSRKAMRPSNSQAEQLPTLQQITNFVAKLCNDTQMEYECIVISLVYVRRLIKKSDGQFALLSDNWKGVILACIVLSNKVWDDFHMSNQDYCHVFKGLTLERVNALELLLLLSIDNRCNVSPTVYAQTHCEIQAMITLKSIETKAKAKTPLSRFSAKFAKVHSEINEENVSKDHAAGTVTISHLEHPSPYRSFGFNADIKPNESTEDENPRKYGPQASVDEYSTFDSSGKFSKIMASVFAARDVGSADQKDDLMSPSSRKRVVQAEELQNQRRNLRVLIQYDENSLIKSPQAAPSTAKTPMSQAGSQASLTSQGNNFKLVKQHSRKNFRSTGGVSTSSGLGVTSPVIPEVMPAVAATKWSFFSFGLCKGKVQDVI